MGEKIERIQALATGITALLERLGVLITDYDMHVRMARSDGRQPPPAERYSLSDDLQGIGLLYSQTWEAIRAAIGELSGIHADMPSGFVGDPRGWEAAVNVRLQELQTAIGVAYEMVPREHPRVALNALPWDSRATVLLKRLSSAGESVRMRVAALADDVTRLRAVPEKSSQEPPSIGKGIDAAELARIVEEAVGKATKATPHADSSDSMQEVSLPELQPHDRQAWQLSLVHGMTQQKVAEALNAQHGTSYKQGQISRMISRAKAHAEASGLSSKLPKKALPPKSVDPSRLELGPRTDKRKPRPSDLDRDEDD